jgi:anaerobic magnesium-protoporphyrin IX monomethyl ester cyclase
VPLDLNVLLVNPPRFHELPVIREERCEITDRDSLIPPYSLLQIAAILRENGHKVSLIDANVSNLKWQDLLEKMSAQKFDLLIFRFTPTTFEWDLKTATLSKSISPKSVTAGICWTLSTVPKVVLESSKDLDVYILHESDKVVPSLAMALSERKNLSTVLGIAYRDGNVIQVNERTTPNLNMDSLPIPAYDLLPSLTHYFVNTPQGSAFTILYSSKGCPFSCIYCTERKTQLKKRSAESILKELRYLRKKYDVRVVSFFDETFTFDRNRAITIAESIHKENLGISWYCNTRVNLVDPELLKILYAGGCRGMSFGIESGSQIILDNAEKGTTVKQAENAIRWAKAAGIKVLCSFIIGLPGENWDTVNQTIAFIKRTLPTGAQINVAVPYPGTRLFEIAKKNNWIVKGMGWDKMYQHESIMRTAELEPSELNEARRLVYRSLYFNPQWWLQNALFIAGHPSDLRLATRYVNRILRNYVLHKMIHAH